MRLLLFLRTAFRACRVRTCFAGLALLAAVRTRGAEMVIQLNVDCALCGPGQAFPHDCPRSERAAPATTAPNPLPALVELARTHYRQLASIEGVKLPAFTEPNSLAALEQNLARYLTGGRSEVMRLEREQASVAQAAGEIAARRERIAALTTQLETQITTAKAAFVTSQRALADEQRRALAAREQFLAWQKVNADLREQIRQARNRLFPRLQQAAQRGWILPPSSYRELPAPQPLKVRIEDRDPAEPALKPTFTVTAQSLEAETFRPDAGTTAPVSARVASHARTQDAELNVRTKLHEFAALYYRAFAAAAARSTTARSGQSGRAELETLTTKLTSLEAAYTTVASQLSQQERQLAQTQTVADTETTRLRDLRQRTLVTLIEGAIYRHLDHRSESVLTPLPAQTPEAAGLRSLRYLAATTARLGADPMTVIMRRPAESPESGNFVARVRQEVVTLRQDLGLTLEFDPRELPTDLAAYLTDN